MLPLLIELRPLIAVLIMPYVIHRESVYGTVCVLVLFSRSDISLILASCSCA